MTAMDAKDHKKARDEVKKQRLAKALRSNLRRRKLGASAETKDQAPSPTAQDRKS